MDHRQLLAGLTEAERLALTRRADAPGLVHLACHFGVIALLGTLIAMGAPGWQLLIPVQGVVLVFLFTLLHETVHETPFATRWLNLWAGRICGFVVILPPLWFRYFHFAHHRFTNDPDRDPELASGKPDGWGTYLAHVSGMPVWIEHVTGLLRIAHGKARDPFLPTNAHDRVTREARWMVAAYAMAMAAMAIWPVLLWVWPLPMLAGQPFLRLYLLAEHGRCPPVANMLENTRTTFTGGLIRRLAWNMPFHAEHHAYPSVPFHKLPAFHAIARPHLKSTSDGYGAFHGEVLKALSVGERRPL